MEKASAVPSDTRSLNRSMGRKAAATAMNTPSRTVPTQGVRNLGWILAKMRGSRPSRAIV